jgi:hypothetical protein
MRDPGPPRRNPFFEHGSDGDLDDPGMGWRDPEEAAPPGSSGPGTRADADADAPGGFAALLALAEALGDAQPEAAEHLVAAAHEVVLTVKVLVDATEAVLAEQRAAMEQRTRSARQARREPSDNGERSDHGDVTDLAAVRRAEGP